MAAQFAEAWLVPKRANGSFRDDKGSPGQSLIRIAWIAKEPGDHPEFLFHLANAKKALFSPRYSL